MPFDLQDRRALATGSTTGIGRRIALTSARDGAEVVMHGRNAERGAEIVTEIGGWETFVAADFDRINEVTWLADEAGDVDILVDNAGYSRWGPSAKLPAGDFNAIFASNVRAPCYVAPAPAMATRGQGTIGSMAGTPGLPGGAVYGATKSALASLTQAWAKECSSHNVRVNVVAAGPMYARSDHTEEFAVMGATTPMNRTADPQEVLAAGFKS